MTLSHRHDESQNKATRERETDWEKVEIIILIGHNIFSAWEFNCLRVAVNLIVYSISTGVKVIIIQRNW